MKTHLQRTPPIPLYALCMLALSLLTACSNQENKIPAGLDTFADSFRHANQASSADSMLALYYLEGTDARTRELLKGALDYELGLPIQSIEFEPLKGAPEETINFVHQGIAYGPSIPPKYRMRVAYAVEDGFTSLFTIGKSPQGDWHIVCAKPKPEPEF